MEDKANLFADNDSSWGKLHWLIGDSVGEGPGDAGATNNRDSPDLVYLDMLGQKNCGRAAKMCAESE